MSAPPVDPEPLQRVLAVSLPLPDRALCGNGKASGFALTRLRKQQRQDAALCAYAALAEMTAGRGPLFALTAPAFPSGRVLVSVLVLRSPDWSARRLDDDNLWRGLKSAIDGLADAGVVANDRQFRMGPITWQRVAPGTGGIILTLTQEA